jgi:predicted NBD/HSP70 family sugar kinase
VAASIVGVDVGGTSIRAVRFDGDLDHTSAASVSLPTPRGAAAVAAAVSSAVISTIEGTDGDPVAVALGMPGRVDVTTGTVSSAVNLGIVEPVAIGALVEARTGLPVHVENDVNAAALGAHDHLGLGPDASLAFINIGTGIAAGFVLGGRLWRGATGSAGEVGHIPMWSHGPRCACGQVGCVEAAASGRAVDADPDRRRDVAASVAWAVQLCAMTLDVDVVALGGGMTEAVGFRDDVVAELEARAASAPMLADLCLPARLAIIPADVPIGSIGAVLARAERLAAP